MILDSRGNPTTEAEVELSDGTIGIASCPSGASTGSHEALELRDGDDPFFGKGVRTAIQGMRKIAKHLCGKTDLTQDQVDHELIRLDGTDNKSKLGANSLLPISLACARAHANQLKIPLYRYLGGIYTNRIPIPMMNILNGGAHASNSLDFQEFMIVPVGFSSYNEALRAGCEIYAVLKRVLDRNGYHTGVGDEGGFAPNLKDEFEALDISCEAIKEAGYDTRRIGIALDVAASEWYAEKSYFLTKSKKRMNAEEMVRHLEAIVDRYPIISI
jgi:enolase